MFIIKVTDELCRSTRKQNKTQEHNVNLLIQQNIDHMGFLLIQRNTITLTKCYKIT
jgi:hypothetical protein